MIDLTNPTNLPDPSEIDYMEEPIVDAEIMVTKDFVGPIMELCQERRGRYVSMEYMEETRGRGWWHSQRSQVPHQSDL